MNGLSAWLSTKISLNDVSHPLHGGSRAPTCQAGEAVKERVGRAIVRLSEHPELGKRLTGLLNDRWSYRVGDWRILYKVKKNELLILVLTVGHRSDVYES